MTPTNSVLLLLACLRDSQDSNNPDGTIQVIASNNVKFHGAFSTIFSTFQHVNNTYEWDIAWYSNAKPCVVRALSNAGLSHTKDFQRLVTEIHTRPSVSVLTSEIMNVNLLMPHEASAWHHPVRGLSVKSLLRWNSSLVSISSCALVLIMSIEYCWLGCKRS